MSFKLNVLARNHMNMCLDTCGPPAAARLPPWPIFVPRGGVGRLGPVAGVWCSSMIDQRILSIQADPQQIRSINDFSDSLARELQIAEGTPSKALTRELLAGGLRRSLDIGGADPKRRFLDALSTNIHKFPLQEQQSLSRVYPVEISSEYRNLRSFVEDGGPEDEPPANGEGNGRHGNRVASTVTAKAQTPSAQAAASAAEELRRRLACLPAQPGPAAEELRAKLLSDELNSALRDAESRARTALFSDLRLNLFKFPELAQRELIERLADLRAEVARLVESMTVEISRWLDEERMASQTGHTEPLLAKLRALFQAILSTPFLATWSNLGDKHGKEAFLLKVALCLRLCSERRFTDMKEIGEHAPKLRRQFFHVEQYGEMMDDWLESRIRQLSEEFTQRAAAQIGSNLSAVVTRLRRTFRPGRWLWLSDSQLEDDIYTLFLDDNFPRHVLSTDSIAKVLRRVSSYGGGDFYIYGNIARLPPTKPPQHATPVDATEASLMEVLLRFPAFPAMKRVRPGIYKFGRYEVEFFLRGGSLVSRMGQVENSAEDFFNRFGPEEYPNASAMAVQSSTQSPSGAPTTLIEAPHMAATLLSPSAFPPNPPGFYSTSPSAAGVPLPPPPTSTGPQTVPASLQASAPLVAGAPRAGCCGCGTYCAQMARPGSAGQAASVPARYEPYSAQVTQTLSTLGSATVRPLLPPAFQGGASSQLAPGSRFGLDDDEI